MISCWKRCREAQRKIAQIVDKSSLVSEDGKVGLDDKIQSRSALITSARELVVSYSGLVIMPGMAESFPQRDE